jgi:murein L,D-transpeptidase YcbB/YkuD
MFSDQGSMRKNLLVASCGIFFLVGADHVSAEHVSSPILKLCEAADFNAAGTPTTDAHAGPPTDAPTEPRTDRGTEKAQAKPIRSTEDVVLSERLQDLIANRLQQYVARPQDRTAVEAFYRGRDFTPLWVNAAGALPSARQAVDFLHGVAADGLDPKYYPTPTFADPDPTRLAADELALTNSIATFVRHASTGRIAFSRVSGSIYFDLKSPDLQRVLEKIASNHDIAATLDSFNPQQPQYKELKAALARARETPDADAVIPANKTKKQSAHQNGRSQSKISAAKIDAILANMERWRWLPRGLGSAYVMVNIPDYTLIVMNGGKVAWSTRIVVGQPGKHATPLLTETMKYITFNPTWNVPSSIIRNEYLPALARDPTALARIGLRIGRNSDGSIRIYQLPSERNALGRVRFNFPNQFLVYQHDTPDKYLFSKPARAYSHGCMRVEYPDKYAETLLSISQPEEGYTVQRIRSLYGRGERNINLKNPIPVYLTYQTVFFDDAGQVQTRPDIYGLDKNVTALLKGEPSVADLPVTRGDSPVWAHATLRHRYEIVEQPYSWDRSWDPYSARSGASTYYRFDRGGSR